MIRIKDVVADFYKGDHFNNTENVDGRVRSLLQENVIKSTYPDLHNHLRVNSPSTILELGCGTGWLCCSVARYYRGTVIGVDYSSDALELAEATWDRFEDLDQNVFLPKRRDRPVFIRADIRELPAIHTKLTLISLGVLHHTDDTFQTIMMALEKCKRASHFYIGLYHFPSRNVFLDIFTGLSEESKYQKFKDLFGNSYDEAHLRGWFRDQVLHVRESCHSILSLNTFMSSLGFELLSTSLNQFKRLPSDMSELDSNYAKWVTKASLNSIFMPGFFTALFQRKVC